MEDASERESEEKRRIGSLKLRKEWMRETHCLTFGSGQKERGGIGSSQREKREASNTSFFSASFFTLCCGFVSSGSSSLPQLPV